MKRGVSAAVWLIVLCFAFPAPAYSAGLKAGAAKVEITPPPGMPLAGYGNRLNVPNTGAHDPVYARALVLESGDKRAAVMSVDLLMITRELKEDVEERVADLDLDFLSISATHTHYSLGGYVDNKVAELTVTGKFRPDAYAWLVERLEQAVRGAAKDLRPAMAAAGKGPGPGISKNRRHPGGPVDPEMRVFAVWSLGGELIAVIMNHALHPTTMPSKTTLVSGDNAGLAELAMEEFHPAAVAMFLNGGEGDQAPDLQGRKPTWEEVEKLGERMAVSAEAVLKKLDPDPEADMTIYERRFPMPKARLRFSLECWGGLNQLFKILGKGMIRKEGEISGLAVNDALFLFSPAEITYEIQKRLEDMFPGRVVLVAAQSNDIWGYVLMPDDYKTGGYESCMSFYGRDFAPLLIREFKAMVEIPGSKLGNRGGETSP